MSITVKMLQNMMLRGLTKDGPISSLAKFIGGGNTTTPLLIATADINGIDFRINCTATTGTTRGAYIKLFLPSGAGGEALRAVCQVENATPADTCNGAHISLMFGTSAGNVTGLATAGRFTLHTPAARTLGGTLSPIMAEWFGDGATSVVSGASSFIQCVLDGDASLKTSMNLKGYLFHMRGMSAGATNWTGANAKMFRTGLTAATSNAATTAALRILIDGVEYFIQLATTAAG